MSFLTPLYFAGLVALSLPLLFHLIRRAPRGQLPFSSLMFLRPSPPRLTRRSRLDHLLLLFLRALALCLLALAFARPFLREVAELDLASSRGRRIALLVDTSASMRRGDLWTQATRHVDEVIDELRPTDQVALFTFETGVRSLVDFEEGLGITPERRAALVRQRLRQVAPTWAATDLGTALVTVADALEAFNDTRELDAALEIILVSDLQEGTRLEGLQAYEWPSEVRLAVKIVAPLETTNAGVQILTGIETPIDAERDRARVTNDADSHREQFYLSWASSSGASGGEPLSVYVPPGQSRVTSVPRPGEDAQVDRLVLSGDDHEFDNIFYFVPPRQENITVKYMGLDTGDDPRGMRYYLGRALAASGRYIVNIQSISSDDPFQTDEDRSARLIVVTEAVSEEVQNRLRSYMSSGGTVLYVLKDARSAKALAGVMAEDGVREAGFDAEEAATVDYAMLSEIDFTHPLFASFADPRFNDFTKIHFWKHRRVDIREGAARTVLARFDNGDPALFEQRHGRGRLLVLTSGWNPEDSQLALSSKFVPLLAAMLEERGSAGLERAYYRVHDQVVLPAGDAKTNEQPVGADPGRRTGPTGRTEQAERTERPDRGEGADDRTGRTVQKPDGSVVKLATEARVFTETDLPGIYRVRCGEIERPFAVNLSPDESRTAPLVVERLEQHGIRLGSHAEETNRRQQLRDLELERRQKIWRWLLAGAVGILIVETWLAGLLSRPRQEAQG